MCADPPSWTQSPLAAALLASCGRDPPRRRARRHRLGEVDTCYAGERVRALKRLYRIAEPRIDTPGWHAWLAVGVEDAIDAAIAAAASHAAAA